MLAPLAADNRGEMFRATRGGPVQHSYFHPKVWVPRTRKAGLEGVRLHDLRHTHASWLIARGIDVVTISRRLGHESITTTIDRYGHLLPDQDAGAAAAVFAQTSESLALRPGRDAADGGQSAEG
jgi:integrase